MMECNKEEAIRAKDIAEKRMQNKDFVGARKIALKAQQLFPDLDNISQMLTVCEVHCSAAVKVNGEMDWYGILQVEPSADDSSIKKQYRKLALLLHPDKNKFAGAEAAFKLIGEAHMTLADRAKRSLHDIKRNANVKIAPSRQPSQQAKNTPYARSNVHNMNFNGLNQQQQQPSAFSGTQTFWTICPTCGMRYQYYKTILNRALRCQNCMKPFIAYDLNAQTVPPGTSSGYPYSSSGIPTQQVPSQQAHNTSQQTQFGHASSSTTFQGNVGGTSVGNSEYEGGSMNKRKEDSRVNVEVGAGNEVKFEKVKLTEVNKKEQVAKPSRVNPSQNRGRRAVVESSDSDSTDSEDIVIEDGPPAEQGAGAGARHCLRRSARQKQNVSYNEDRSDGDGEDDFMNPPRHKRLKKGGSSCGADRSVKDFLGGDANGLDVGTSENNISEGKMDKKQKRGTMCDEKLPNGSGEATEDNWRESKQGTIEKEEISQAGLDSSVDSSSKASLNVGSLSYPDPEFFDFEKLRSPIQFAVDQIWAVYDNLDGMPRFYARIRQVYAPNFKLRFTWLEHEPTNKAEIAWSDEELPVACGNFRLGKSEVTEDRLMFSHVISWEKGRRRNSYDIYPRKGEVWALYKDWDIGWISDPDSHRLYEYEIVEVSDVTAGTGITVVPLVKTKGFVSLFIRAKGEITPSFVIPPNEILRFSHRIPSYRMTGAERAGIPKGCFELDSASLPNNFDEIFDSISLDSLMVGVENLDNEFNSSYPKTALDEENLGTVKIGETENMKCQNFSSHGTNGVCEQPYHASTSRHNATAGSNYVNETKASREEIDKNNVDLQNANANSDAECHDPSTSSCQSPITYVYPESEFHNFEEDKAIENFQHGQIWALYSDIDKYPKYYGWIRKIELEDFRVHLIWLEAYPSREEEKRWLEEELPIGCGTFKVASGSITFDTTEAFSHLVQARPTGRKNQYVILPGIGEIWAVYKKWRAGWTLSDLENCEYDLVEICERTSSGIKVSLLTKVNGYRAVFRSERKGNAMAIMEIPEDEFLRFSHRIPAFQLTDERGGKLRGYWELDPASVPENFLFTNVD